MSNISPGERDPAKMTAAIRQLYAGGSNNTGTVKLRASQTTTVVNHESVTPNSHISIMPLTASALAATMPLVTLPTLTDFAPKMFPFTRVLSAAAGNVSYTGIGFKPSLIQFMAAVVAGNPFAEIGAGDGTNEFNVQIASSSTAFTSFVFSMIDAGGAAFQQAALASLDVDGFTLTYTKTGAPTSTWNIVAVCHPPKPVLAGGGVTPGGVYVSARTLGSFTLAHPSNAASDQNFTYSVTGGA